MKTGELIVFSGLDGAGKSTQIELVMTALQNAGQKPIYLWTRGGYTPFFEMLKLWLRRLSGRKIVPPSGHSPRRSEAFSNAKIRKIWLIVALLDLMWVYGVQVRWQCWRGRIVVCDRYLWDTLIDFRLNFSQENVENWWLWRLLVRITPNPDVAFLLLVPVEESLRRSDIKGEPFRDSPEVLASRLAQYYSLARLGDWYILDGKRSIVQLENEIRSRIDALKHSNNKPLPI